MIKVTQMSEQKYDVIASAGQRYNEAGNLTLKKGKLENPTNFVIF